MSCHALPLYAQQHRQFSVRDTANSEVIHGQIDWPGGSLSSWSGHVLVFISPGNPLDRDGWTPRALDSAWAGRLPLKELSDALLEQGMAVVRFDSPGVLPPSRKCRETIFKQGLSADILRKQCFDIQVIHDITVEQYVRNIERMLLRVQK